MITTQLNGRTGNNMFQIAAAIAVAKRNNVEAFYIGDGSYIQGFKLKGIKKGDRKAEFVFEERKFNFDESFNSLGDRTHLDGYFQSEKNFISAEDEVRKCFSFDHHVVEAVKRYEGGKFKHFLETNENTAVHIRRTDYLKYPDVYPIFDSTYYERCLNSIHDKGRVIVFSDDMEWCRNTFKGKGYDYIDLPPIESMYLMSNCKNIIMANSSFSWWAAWIGKCENVIYPRNWFGKRWPHKDKHLTHEECVKDLCPERWKKFS